DLAERQKDGLGLLAYQLGFWYHQRNSLSRAEEWMSMANSLLPENEEVLANFSALQLLTGNFAGAVTTLNNDLEGKTNKAVLYGYRAVARSRINDFDNAIADYKSALQHGNNDESISTAYI